MLRYGLLVITWLINLGAIIILWIQNGSVPNFWLWIILAGLSLIPLAGRLKIGNWIDFGKNIDNKNSEGRSEREKLINISNYNVSLATEEAARAFLKSHNAEDNPKSPNFTSDDKLTDSDKNAIEFMYNADKALGSVHPLVQILYAAVTTKIKGKSLTMENFSRIVREVPKKDILSMTEEIKSNFSYAFEFKDSDKKASELFEPVIELINIRKRFEKDETTLPRKDDLKALIFRVDDTISFLTGMVAMSTSAMLSLPLFFQISGKPASSPNSSS